MPGWFIEPRDPLIVRDGRPFGADPGARARSLGFPLPSTTTGGLRNRAGLADSGAFDPERIAEVLQIAVRGPLLAALNQEGELATWLPTAPADALLLPGPGDGEARVIHLAPLKLPQGAAYSPPAGAEGLALVGPSRTVNEKPLPRPPRFWHWPQFEQWLTTPQQLAAAPVSMADLGVAGPVAETRTHVSIQAETRTAEDGRLFQTSGLEFTATDQTRLALGIESDAALPRFDKGGVVPLGGERRLMAWRPNPQAFPACTPALRELIVAKRSCRVILLTPAHFTAGYRPSWLLGSHAGVQAELVAALVQRPQVISGWDMRERRPKPTRRLAPAGSVFFVQLPGADRADDAAIEAWIDAIWMQNISDDHPGDPERDRRDGFGLAVLGAWNGELMTMEVQK